MATTLKYDWQKIYSISAGSDGYRTYTIEVWLACSDQSAANNTSKLWWEVGVRTTSAGGGSGYNSTVKSHTLNVGGNSFTFSTSYGTYENQIPDGKYTKFADGTKTITHADNGTWANKSVTYSGYAFNGSTAISASGTSVTIPAIDRPSTVSLSTTSMVANGSNSVTITANKKSSAFRHKITATYSGHTENLNGGNAIPVVNSEKDAYEWTPAKTVFNYASSTATSMTVTFSIQTYTNSNCTTKVGSAITKTMTLSTNSSAFAPTITVSGVAEQGSNLSGVTGYNTVQYLSKKKISFTYSFVNNNTTLSSITCKCGSTTYSANGSGTSRTFTATNPTSATYSITVKDSRGYSTTWTSSGGQFIQYTYPTVGSVSVARDTETQGGEAVTLTSGKLQATGAYYAGQIGNTTNAVSVTYKIGSGSTVSLTDVESSGAWTVTDAVIASGLELTNSYTFTVTVTDAFNQTQSREFVLGPVIEPLWIGRDTVRVHNLVVDGAAYIPNIGYYTSVSVSDENAVSLTSGSSGVVASITITPSSRQERWLLLGNIKFASNATGRRVLYVGEGSTIGTNPQTNVSQPAVSGGVTMMSKVIYFAVSTSITINVVGYQNSGSALDATAYIRAIRIR